MDAKTLGEMNRDRLDNFAIVLGCVGLAFLVGRIAGGGL